MRLSFLSILAVLSLAICACGEKQDYQAPASPSAQEPSDSSSGSNDLNSNAGTTNFDYYDYADDTPGIDFDRVVIDKLDFFVLGSRNYYLITTKALLNGQTVACDYHYSNTGVSAPLSILDFEAQFAAVNSDPGKREGASRNAVRSNPDYCNDFADQAISNIENAGAVKTRSDETALIKARWNNTGL